MQSFNADLFRLSGQITMDPDFDLLRVTAGTDFGLTSPGHTTLTKSGSDWGVDSFFDISLRIDGVRAQAGRLPLNGSLPWTVCFRTGGDCVHTPVNCDDGDPCTADSCDPGSGACRHVARTCDDGNACTIDTCNPQSGCAHQPVPPAGEPSPARFDSQVTFIWPASPNATHWNTYRGTIPAGMLGSRLPGSVYDQACFESAEPPSTI